MGAYATFQTFCSELRMTAKTVETIRNRYHSILGIINREYWNSSSSTTHGLYVGSYGRGTEIWTSDIDIIVELPSSLYWQYSNYSSNGQSALLQDVKNVLQHTYPTTNLRGDGQVIVIRWSDGIRFEIVPAFQQTYAEAYWYPDTHNGGSWEITNPRAEIREMNNLSEVFGRSPKDLCRMVRAWKYENNADMHGIVIDSLVHNFFWSYVNPQQHLTYTDYGELSRDFFYYLSQKGKVFWVSAPGSNSLIEFPSDVSQKADRAYKRACEALADAEAGCMALAEEEWQKIYGDKFTIQLS